jgi:malate dehydrogenase (oxaloacetate-decarboxylating)(NADP+)
MPEDYSEESLAYHRKKPYGKLEITATKPLLNQRDLSLAYSPGVAAACIAIADDPAEAATLTSRANLVGVISDGTAVLGLGDIGPLAAKPVMEGKAVLFKKFAGVDVFDIEIDQQDPQKLIEIIKSLEPTFGGINLEDISAPGCFIVEDALREQMNIPVFHDDQHGTAIIVAAAVRNALLLTQKDITEVKLCASGAGAASLACLSLLVSMGMRVENINIIDSVGVVYKGRTERMDEYKEKFATETEDRTLEEAIKGADIFLGLSVAGVLKPEFLDTMAEEPIIMALANPVPEILPELALEVRPDAILATGRSDYPNQVNNVLCFPYLFRGALDVGATTINERMKIAAVDAIANLAKRPPTQEVDKAYGGSSGSFGPQNIIPKPFDPRLILEIAPAVAKAAMDTGVATRPIEDFDQYVSELNDFVYRSSSLLKPIFDQARQEPKRVIYAEGERRSTLQAVQQVVSLKLARPILLGRPDMIRLQIKKIGLKIDADKDIEIIYPMDNPHFKACWNELHSIMGREGMTPAEAKHVISVDPTMLGSILVRLGLADAMLTGTVGPFAKHLNAVKRVAGIRKGATQVASMMVLFLPTGTFFLSDTHVAASPNADELTELTIEVATAVRRFGVTPKIALLSRSNFGSRPEAQSSMKIKEALERIREIAPDLEIDGEMHADAALSEKIRDYSMPDSTLKGQANTLIMPRGDAAHISYNLLKMLGGGTSVGPILVGCAYPIHVLTNSATVRGIVNMTAISVVDAQSQSAMRGQ